MKEVKEATDSTMIIKTYNGYGHAHNMHAYGHVFKNKFPALLVSNKNFWSNLRYLFRCFKVNPVAGIKVVLQNESQKMEGKTEDDGFFALQWQEPGEIPAGWQEFSAHIPDTTAVCTGKVYVPHSTQYAFISDIDDTVVISYSSSPLKKIWQLLSNAPAERKIFDDVARHYTLLAAAHTLTNEPNPFFYVSSSEWNLYDYLHKLFSLHQLPEGIFLLNQVKQLHQLFKTGTGKHEGKLLRIVRIFEAFPIQRFVLFGDNSQQDPFIYQLLTEKYPDRIHAVYIRRVNKDKATETQKVLENIASKNIATCFFEHSKEAIAHSLKIGLLDAVLTNL